MGEGVGNMEPLGRRVEALGRHEEDVRGEEVRGEEVLTGEEVRGEEVLGEEGSSLENLLGDHQTLEDEGVVVEGGPWESHCCTSWRCSWRDAGKRPAAADGCGR